MPIYSFFRFRVILPCVALFFAGALGVRLLPVRALSQPALVKTDNSPAVYYVYNNQRYAFPNEKTYYTWYSDFSSVVTISPSELASYPLVKNVTYRPNDRLLKITTDPHVYAVSRCGVLHWIATEQLAQQLWGSQWNRLIDDLPDTFFSSYTVGNTYTQVTDYLVDPTVKTIADNVTCATTTNPLPNTPTPTTTNPLPNTPTTTPPVVVNPSQNLTADSTVTIDLQRTTQADAQRLLGMTFDARTSITAPGSTSIPAGYYSPTDASLLPGVASFWNAVTLTTLRYPGNAVSMNFDWKQTVGPVAQRLPQVTAKNQSQVIKFGFDDFMAMAQAKGAQSNQIQIMVPIYAGGTLADPVAGAADWVEYANAPNDGSNPGGGVDWAAVRATNGHPQPYGIRIWNIGNEPWSPSEFNFDPAKYLPVAVPIIDAMRKIDPTIQITLPAVGDANTKWNQGLLNASSLQGKVYGLSPHYFYDEDSATASPSVEQSRIALASIAVAAKAKGWKVVVGDHAHAIQKNASGMATINMDYAMQWRGAVTTADFLLMTSQIDNIDRANFWIFGMPTVNWHPVRRNTDGTYTVLPVATLYQLLPSVFQDRAVSSVTASPVSSDGASYSVRSVLFQKANSSASTLVAVNRDFQKSHVIGVKNGLTSPIKRVRLMTASGATAETVTIAEVAFSASDTAFSLPAGSILLVDY